MNEWVIDVRRTSTGRGTEIRVDADTVPEALAQALVTVLAPTADDDLPAAPGGVFVMGADNDPEAEQTIRAILNPPAEDGTFCGSCGRQTSGGPDGNDLCNACIAGQH